MPDLEPKNIEGTFRTVHPRFGFAKFLREGNRIYWDLGETLHTNMVQQSKMTTPEDAGRFLGIHSEDGNFFKVYGHSSDLNIPVTIEARNRTLALWNEMVRDQGYSVKPEIVKSLADAWEV